MLSTLFISQTVNAVHDALDSAGIDSGVLTVLDQPRLGRALTERGHRILQIADKAKSLRRIASDRMCSRADALPLGDAELAAVIASGLGQQSDWKALLAEWSRVTRHGGSIILIDRASGTSGRRLASLRPSGRSPATELTRRTLCGGLTEIEQRRLGRTIVTSGRVVKLQI